MSEYCIGIDLGGTFIKLVVLAVDEDGNKKRFLGITQRPTPSSHGDQIVAEMIRGVKNLLAEQNIDSSDVLGVGIGAPGPLNCSRGVIINAPNIPGLAGLPLRDLVGRGLNLPAVLENDANAAALGEFMFGAAKGARSLAMLTLGTGVGGGIIVDGKILHGSHDSAGEIGHIIVETDGLPCNCGQRGCLEQYASAKFIARQAVIALRGQSQKNTTGCDDPAAGAGQAGRKGTIGQTGALAKTLAEKGDLDAADVNAARKAGDPLAERLWDSAARHLAIACVSLQRVLDCDMIVLAGGLAKAGDDLLDPVRRHFSQLDWRMTEDRPRLVIAALGSDAGVIGAAAVAWQAFGRP
ncbi:MAG: ROK family protein [Planctomycetes bacterium]|nr:ROK family protein [Planctomycetota bacterium]